MSAHKGLALVLLLAVFTATAATSSAVATSAQAPMQRYLRALGGSERLRAVTSRTTHSTLSAGLFKLRVESRQAWPDRVVEDSTLALIGSQGNSGYDGQNGWLQEIGKPLRRLRGAELQRYVQTHRLDWWQRLDVWYPTSRLLASDGTMQRLELRDALGQLEVWSFDTTTGLLVQVNAAPQGKPVLTRFSDYREVDGLQLPFHIEGSTAAGRFRIEIESVVHNLLVRVQPPAALESP